MRAFFSRISYAIVTFARRAPVSRAIYLTTETSEPITTETGEVITIS